MMNRGKYRKIRYHTSNRRGATLFIVLGVLSILSVISLVLAYTSRLEVRAAKHYSYGIQARMASVAGLAQALNSVGEKLDLPHPAELSPKPDKTTAAGDVRSSKRAREIAYTHITDESAKININLPGYIHNDGSVRLYLTSKEVDEINLTKAISRILENARMDSSKSTQIAREIFEFRTASPRSPVSPAKVNIREKEHVGSPAPALTAMEQMTPTGVKRSEVAGRSNMEQDNKRTVPREDRVEENLFLSTEELQTLGSVTPEIYEAISPYFTVYSMSMDVFDINGSRKEKLLLNSDIPQKVYEILRIYFPDKQKAMLIQFAANLVDRRDKDNVPTILVDEDTFALGVEKTPYINEVFPNAPTPESDGDDGQFVELYNPYPEEISLSGWRLSTGAQTVRLTGKIMPNGYVIVTDDFNNATDPDPEEGSGSFYEFFHKVPNGYDQVVIEDFLMDLPNEMGEVRLYDAEGNEIDVFFYDVTTFTPTIASFQRDDPRVRYSRYAFPSPFAPNWERTGSEKDDRAFRKKSTRDTAFTTLGELLDVPSGYALAEHDGKGWLYPSIALKGADEIDSRILDVFSIAGAKVADTPPLMSSASAYREESEPFMSVFGRLNVNSASAEALEALPGIDEDLAEAMVNYRQLFYEGDGEEEARAQDEMEQGAVPFSTVSKALRYDRLWHNIDDKERVRRFGLFSNWIATDSLTYNIISKQRVGPVELEEAGSGAPIKALISLDPAKERIIHWRYESK